MSTAEDNIIVAAGWNKNMAHKLKELWESKEGANLNLHIGTSTILAHKLIVEINSDIMKKAVTIQNPLNDMTEVLFDQDLLEKPALIESIIVSFYTGVLVLKDDELVLTYKFADAFQIPWLLEPLRKRFDEDLNEKTFIDMCKFASTVECKILKTKCLGFMDDDLANKLIQSEDDLLKMDFEIITKFALMNNPKLSEVQIFELINKWLKDDVNARKEHIQALLTNIRSQLKHGLDPLEMVDPHHQATGIKINQIKLGLLDKTLTMKNILVDLITTKEEGEEEGAAQTTEMVTAVHEDFSTSVLYFLLTLLL